MLIINKMGCSNSNIKEIESSKQKSYQKLSDNLNNVENIKLKISNND